MTPQIRGGVVALAGLALIALLAMWLVAHILIKIVVLVALAVGTVILARALSRPLGAGDDSKEGVPR